MSSEITPGDFPEVRWHGHWVWSEPAPQSRFPFGSRDGESKRPEARSFFRKTFALTQVPARPGTHHRRFTLSAVRQRAGSLSRADPQPAAPPDL